MVLAVVVCVGWIATQSRSQDKKPAAGQPAMPAGMTPEQQAQMDAMMKLAIPGPQHEAMKAMAGTFKADCSMTMNPSAPPEKSTGMSENELILGGRFMQQKFKGEMSGQPFEGIGFTGYDNFKKKYVSTWMDSMGTMMMVSEGTADASGKVLTLMSEMPDPVSGKMMKCRMVTTIESNDKHNMVMYAPGPDGKEMNCMSIVYTRVK
jgi:hypothetical protein